MDLSHIVNNLHEKYDRGKARLKENLPEYLNMSVSDAAKAACKTFMENKDRDIRDIAKDLSDKYGPAVKYNKSLIISEIAAPLGAAGLAYLCHTAGMNEYVSSIGGGIAGNYISAVAAFNLSWYFLNKGRYRNNISAFFKDSIEIMLKELAPALVQYGWQTLITALLVYNGTKDWKAAFYASLISEIIFIPGSNIANYRIMKEHSDDGSITEDTIEK